MKKLFKVKNEEGRNSIIWLCFDEDSRIFIQTLKGVTLTMEETLKVIFSQEEVYSIMKEYINREGNYKRINPYKFIIKTGMSGCRNFFIKIAERTEYDFVNFKNIFLFHLSCYDKINEQIDDLFIYDLIDLLRYYDLSNDPLFDFDLTESLEEIRASIIYEELTPITDEDLKRDGFIFSNIRNQTDRIINLKEKE